MAPNLAIINQHFGGLNHHFPMVFPHFPMVFLWFSYGFPTFSYGFPTFSYGFPIVFLWFSHLFLWFSYGPETAPGPQPRLRGPLARSHGLPRVAHVADAAGGAGESATAAALLAAQLRSVDNGVYPLVI